MRQFTILLFLGLPFLAMDGFDEKRGPENKAFNNVRVYNTLQVHDLYVQDDVVIGGNLKVNGNIHGCGSISGPSSSTPNAIARFADTTGASLIDSLVLIDDLGNVTGIQSLTASTIHAQLQGTALDTLFVDGQSASAVADATELVLSATDENIYDSLVRRDSTGSFVTTMITITGVVTNADDVATKEYVDLNAGVGMVIKTPALVMSISDTPTVGIYTLDGVSLIVGNRILLTAQTNAVDNGLWEVQVGNWARPADFPLGAQANDAYVLTTSGTQYAGSGWVCTTPQAIIGNDPLTFVQFSSPGNVVGMNVGSGTGTIYKTKDGNILKFKSLEAGGHLVIVNGNDDITLTVTANSNVVPNTLVVRDALGNFSANVITGALTGTASENILRAGDTMTGTFTVIAGSPADPSLQFAGSHATGLSAQTPNTLVFSTDGVARMSISSTGTVSITQLATAGVVHTYADGALTSTLIVDADISPVAAIADTKLATISTPGKVLDSATTATSDNVPNTIVRRDSSGNFFANVITATTIIGATTQNVLKAGDTMTGTFTVIAGTAANPSLQFSGSSHTGLSASTPNTLVFSTDGVERMSINETGTVTLKNTLVIPAGTLIEPALQFVGSVHTGITSAQTDKLSFVIDGAEHLCVDDTSVTVTGVPLVLGTVLCLQSTQTVSVSGTLSAVTIEDGISTLVVSYTGPSAITTLTLPPHPFEGQLVTIKAIRLGNGNLDIVNYNPAFSPVSEAIIQLSPNANLAGNAGGASVTYIWLTSASGLPDGWYRYARG